MIGKVVAGQRLVDDNAWEADRRDEVAAKDHGQGAALALENCLKGVIEAPGLTYDFICQCLVQRRSISNLALVHILPGCFLIGIADSSPVRAGWHQAAFTLRIQKFNFELELVRARILFFLSLVP